MKPHVVSEKNGVCEVILPRKVTLHRHTDDLIRLLYRIDGTGAAKALVLHCAEPDFCLGAPDKYERGTVRGLVDCLIGLRIPTAVAVRGRCEGLGVLPALLVPFVFAQNNTILVPGEAAEVLKESMSFMDTHARAVAAKLISGETLDCTSPQLRKLLFSKSADPVRDAGEYLHMLCAKKTTFLLQAATTASLGRYRMPEKKAFVLETELFRCVCAHSPDVPRNGPKPLPFGQCVEKVKISDVDEASINNNFGDGEKRRFHESPRQTIAGVLAAKRAVRALFATIWEETIKTNHIQLYHTESGAPRVKIVTCEGGDSQTPRINISVSHTAQYAYALAWYQGAEDE